MSNNKSIDEYGGILKYLDATKDKHNGYGAEDFERNYHRGPGFIRDLFGTGGKSKQRATATDWIKRYKREKGINDDNT